MWSWRAHNWITEQLSATSPTHKAIFFSSAFLGVYIFSYVVAALTPLWIRTLEGKNWPKLLRDHGKQYHSKYLAKLTNHISSAVKVYATIDRSRSGWNAVIIRARELASKGGEGDVPSPTTRQLVDQLDELQGHNSIIDEQRLESLVQTYAAEIRARGLTPDLEILASDITRLTDYARDRTLTEYSRLLNERNTDFGDREEIAPTRFGNIGLSAQAYSMRAYHCNVTRIWSELQRAIEKQEIAKALEGCKSQLDFLVACYYLSVAIVVLWSLLFAWSDELLGAFLCAGIGTGVCWFVWYGAAVEQYRVLQNLIISALNSSRFQVISELRLNLPADLLEERHLWRTIDFAIGNGERLNIRYNHPTT
jgi:hypothetical protein